MGDGDLLNSFEWFCSSGNIVDSVKNIGVVIPCAASIADADDDALKDDKSFLVLECLALDLLGANGSFAVLAPITVRGIVIGLC